MGDSRTVRQQLDENVSKYCVASSDSAGCRCEEKPEVPHLPPLPSFDDIPATDEVTSQETTHVTTLLSNLPVEVSEMSTLTDPTTNNIITTTRSGLTSQGTTGTVFSDASTPYSGKLTDSLTFSTSTTNIYTPDITTDGQSTHYYDPLDNKTLLYTLLAFLAAMIVIAVVVCVYWWYKKKRNLSEDTSSSLQSKQDFIETDMSVMNLVVSPICPKSSDTQVIIEHNKDAGSLELTPADNEASKGEEGTNGERSSKNADPEARENGNKGGNNTGENAKENTEKKLKTDGKEPLVSANDSPVQG